MTLMELRDLRERLNGLAETSHNYERQIAIIQALGVVDLAATMAGISDILMEIRDHLGSLRDDARHQYFGGLRTK